MAKMWAVTKMSINAIPAPKSLQELEYLLMTMGSIVSQKLALLKALAGGKHPNLQNKLESLGHNPDRGTVQSSEIYIRMELSHWSRRIEAALSFVKRYITMKYFRLLLRQLSYAIKNQRVN